jgi:exodeoxyribonuclease VII small subunit
MANNEKFEQKLERAKALLEKLSAPDLALDASMAYYKEGVTVLKEASKLLEEAKQEFEVLSSKESR